jgi:hypothetical protein
MFKGGRKKQIRDARYEKCRFEMRKRQIRNWSGGKAKKGDSPKDVSSAFKIGYSNAT